MKKIPAALAVAFLLLFASAAWPLPSPGFHGTASANVPPVAVAGNLTLAEPGEMVFFHAHDSHDPDGEIVLYEWDFEGDDVYDWNSTDNGTTFHTYEKERAYNATLRVTDNNGTTATDIFYIIIAEEDDDQDVDDLKTVLYIVGIAEIIFGSAFVGMVWWWRRNLYSG
jgi:hypothetical protein